MSIEECAFEVARFFQFPDSYILKARPVPHEVESLFISRLDSLVGDGIPEEVPRENGNHFLGRNQAWGRLFFPGTPPN